MEDDLMKSARFEGKKTFELPKGATIIKKSHTLCVKEIENGYLLSKDYNIEWTDAKGNNHYEYFCKEWFSKENPIEIKITSDDKSLAEKLDD